MFYHYNCETYKGEKCKIVVKANSKEEAWNRIADYDVCRGELKFAHLTEVTETGKEQFYKPTNNGIALAVAFAGAALGMTQVSQYGINKDYKKALTEETIQIIKNNA